MHKQQIPMIIALNKMDKETANPDKIKKELSEMNILVEEWVESTNARRFGETRY